MKTRGLHCIAAGLAVCCMVLPIEWVMAQSMTVQEAFCKVTPANPTEAPSTVFCDRAAGSCNATTKTFHYDVGLCVHNDESGDCFTWTSPSSQTYTIVYVDEGLLATQLGLALGASVVCFFAGTSTTLLGGLLTTVICGGVAFALSTQINRCDFGRCKIDMTIPNQPGPMHFVCQ